ncbi:MAG: metallopeptidase family protein [Alphaproteobacteria bacterium]
MHRLPTLDEMHAVALDAYASIPDEMRRFVEGVVIRIADFPDDETIDEMELESEYDLLGLYRGVAVGDKGSSYIAHDVDMIFLYRMPIIDYWQETGEDLQHIIRHVLIHEIGHHFGLSDDDMERIEAQS